MKIRARATDATHSERTLQILGLCCRHFWMAMRLSCKFRFHIGMLNQHWLVERGRRPIGRWSSCRPGLHAWPRSFTAPLTREALRAERRAAAERAAQGVLKVAFSSFLDQLPPRLPPRPSTNPTFTSFLTQTPIMLTKELLKLPDAPSLLAQRCKLWRELLERHHLRFVTVCGLRVVCTPTISSIPSLPEQTPKLLED